MGVRNTVVFFTLKDEDKKMNASIKIISTFIFFMCDSPFGASSNLTETEYYAGCIDPVKQEKVDTLHVACGQGDVQKVREYLENSSFSVNMRDSLDRTPLHTACLAGQIEVVTLLLDHMLYRTFCKKEMFLFDQYGQTALYDACEKEHIALVELLLKRGASTQVKNDKGKTPLEYTKHEDIKTIIKHHDNWSRRKFFIMFLYESQFQKLKENRDSELILKELRIANHIVPNIFKVFCVKDLIRKIADFL